MFIHTNIYSIQNVLSVLSGCGDGGAESGDGGAASASPRVEEPPPVPPAAGSPAVASPASGTPGSATPVDGTPAAGTPDGAGGSAGATATLPVPTDVSPTADSWEAEADDALLTPEENNEPEDEETEQPVSKYVFIDSQALNTLSFANMETIMNTLVQCYTIISELAYYYLRNIGSK